MPSTIFDTKDSVFFVGGRGPIQGLSDDLIAHYKMNENTASDNDELVTNGDFADWTDDDPDGWTVTGESGNDPEISEAATGEAHADTPTPGGGMCNIYTSDGTSVGIYQVLTLVVGRKYRVSVYCDTATAGGLKIIEMNHVMWTQQNLTASGTTYTWTFVATHTDPRMGIFRQTVAAIDVTIDDISIKLCAVEDSSGNDHDGLLAEDTDAAHVAGKINGAFDFDGSSDFIEIADHADFTPALTPFSISEWVYMHDATDFVIASKGVEGTDGEWRFYTDGADKPIVHFYDESINKYIGRKYDTAITSYQNKWVHLVMTYDGSALSTGIKLYLNGVRIDDTTDESATFVSVENLAHPVWIGRYDTDYANGLIDNVMFYSKELTPGEVEQLYTGGHGTELDNGYADAGGGCTAALWGDLKAPSKDLADIMGTNGEPLSDGAAWNGSQTACTLSADGTGKMRITRAGCFSDCIVGLIARVHTTGVAVPEDVDDRFEVIGVDAGGDYIDVNAVWVEGGTGDVKVGGAIDKLQTAADETTADSLTEAQNVDILTNKAETFSGAGDQIDLDTGGGDTGSGTKKRIIGVDTDGVELAAGSWVTIDADGNACHVFAISGAIDGVELYHIAAINANAHAKAGFSFTVNGKGFVLKDCKSTGCMNGICSGSSSTAFLTVIGGYYSSSSRSPIHLLLTYGITLKGVVVECGYNWPAIQSGGYGVSLISGCVITGNGNIACDGVALGGSHSMTFAENNVMYNVGHGFDVNNLTCGLVEVDNVIVVAGKASGKAISFTAGSVLHSDHSCLWALDGAPAAADRWGPYGMGEHSIEADPLFMDAANGDFRFQSIELFGSAADSPCLNTGTKTLEKA